MMMTTLALLAMLCAEARPEGVRVSTWVREDIFAGFLANEMTGFEKGMAKVEAILAAEPSAFDAVAWRAGGWTYRAVRALEAGDRAQFDALYRRAQEEFARARAGANADQMAAVLAVRGGTFAILADRLPAELRKEGWAQVRDHYGALRDLQKDYFAKMPLHMRGEVLAGLAQAEQRLTGAPGSALTELLTALPDSVYANRARRWQEKPEIAARTGLTCQTCHDAGRLETVLAKQPKR